jgi:hypothetical protein
MGSETKKAHLKKRAQYSKIFQKKIKAAATIEENSSLLIAIAN